NAAPAAQIMACPLQVLTGLHAVPLVRRVRLGNEVGNRRRHVYITAYGLLTDPGDLFRHIDDAVEVDHTLARQAAHEVQFHAPPAVLERLPAAFVEIIILDLLADLLAHVIAGHFGRQRQPAPADALHQLRQRA